MYKLALAFAAYGLVLAILAIRTYAVGGSVSGPASELSLQALLDNGPGQNPRVILTDFNFTNRFIHADGRFRSGWRCVWFVVAPQRKDAASPETDVNLDMTAEFLGDGNAGPRTVRVPRPIPKLVAAPKRVRALIMSKDLRNENDLGLFVQHHQGRVHGPVTVAADSLSRRDQEFLKQHFNGIDLTSCLIIHADGYQRDVLVVLALALGAGFCLVTSGMLVRQARRQKPKPGTPPRPAAAAALDPEEEEALYLWQREQHQRRPPSNYV